MPIKAIIFDFGGVLVRLNCTPIYRALAHHSALHLPPRPSPYFLARLSHDLQNGKLTLAEWHQKLVKDIHLTLTLSELKHLWINIVQEPIKNVVTLLPKLRNHYDLYLLSDTEKFMHATFKHKIPRVFKKQFFSYNLGHTKAAPATFLTVLKKIHHKPSHCLFIDDLAEYTRVAQHVGMHTIRYTKNMNLPAALQRFGIYLEK